MIVKVFDIEWDTSDFTEEEELASGCCIPDLPTELEDLDIPDEVGAGLPRSNTAECEEFDNVVGEWIASYLRKSYGHEHDHFCWDYVE